MKLGADHTTEWKSFVTWSKNVQFLDAVCKIGLVDGDTLFRILFQVNADVLEGCVM